MKSVLIQLLRIYQRFLSPMFLPACRFVPTCSEYAVDAIAYHGALRGSWMAFWRLLRCHPFAKGGVDPACPRHTSATIFHNTISQHPLGRRASRSVSR